MPRADVLDASGKPLPVTSPASASIGASTTPPVSPQYASPGAKTSKKRGLSTPFIIVLCLIGLPVVVIAGISAALIIGVQASSLKNANALKAAVAGIQTLPGCTQDSQLNSRSASIDTVEAMSVIEYTCSPATADNYLAAIATSLVPTPYQAAQESAPQPTSVTLNSGAEGYMNQIDYRDHSFTNLTYLLEDAPGKTYYAPDKATAQARRFTHYRLTVSVN
ncbi:hypothetical protein HJC99_01625 [Candidatus Saccharibacteria bacterium]|nr:hypothetical protein [Candidatus Saccharibacteria bacterium]